jgi:cytochrome P450
MPLLGNLLQVDRERLHQKAEQWAREYGEAYRFRITSREFVVMSNPEAVATILRDRPEGFQRTQRLNETARAMGFGGLFSSNGEAWKRQRPMVLSGLDPSHIKAFFPTLARVTDRLARRWRRAAAAGGTIDLQADLMRYTVDVTAGLAFGTDMNTIESDEEVIQTHLDKILPALFKRLLAPFRYWHFIRLPSDRELDRHLAALRVAVDGFIADTRRRLSQRPELRQHPTNLIEAMVASRDREGSAVTDEDVAGNVLTMLLAGEDTTANTLAWMIWLLHRHPEAAQRVADEARSVLGDHGVPMHHEDLSRLDFVEACAHETMRIKPVAPINIQQAVRDTVVAGVAMPAGTLVMCLMRPAAVDERHFTDAHSFRPERWLGGVSASSAKRVAMPFGAGPRICPGRYLALAEMKMVIAMLFAAFDVAAVATSDGSDAQERHALTMSPVGLKKRMSKRSPTLR